MLSHIVRNTDTEQTRRVIMTRMNALRCGAAAAALCGLLGLAPAAWSEDSPGAKDARALFKKMSDYVSGQKAISFSFDSNIEIVTPDLQKLTFASFCQATDDRQSRRDDRNPARRSGT